VTDTKDQYIIPRVQLETAWRVYMELLL